MAVRTRFAPSPTGLLHIGGVRTALFCWLYARHTGGQFILRIEDTDRERSSQASVDAILEGMRWLGLDYDEGPFYQSRRFDRYREVVERLLAAGQAYHCYCSKEELATMRAEQMAAGLKPRYDRRCRARHGPVLAGVAPVVRFKNPVDGAVVFDDVIRGHIAIDNGELDDLIIARADGTPTYNFTVVVDDMDMAISHVIRGDDHINNTPRQINIFRALGAESPVYAHVPMILGDDGQRLSKRHGAVSVLAYREAGYLPEAVLNYLVRLGWSHGDQEIFSTAGMIALFDIADVNKAASTFNTEKLNWLNQHYIKQADTARLAALLAVELDRRDVVTTGGPASGAVAEVLHERVQTISEMADKSLYFYREFDEFENKAATRHLRGTAAALLRELGRRFTALADWQPAAIHRAVEAVAVDHGVKIGKVAQPLRVAVTGTAASPPIDVTVALIGRSRVLARIERAIDYLGGHPDA